MVPLRAMKSLCKLQLSSLIYPLVAYSDANKVVRDVNARAFPKSPLIFLSQLHGSSQKMLSLLEKML